MRRLCDLSELPEGAARGFPPAPGSFIGLFAVRHRDQIHVYLNSCPHIGLALDWEPNQFLSHDMQRIVCATHGAEFRIEDGETLSGPCLGEHLTKINCHIENGALWVADTAGL
jgi:nitrite reductase/ring-hydroxylating ferredoxin subunit